MGLSDYKQKRLNKRLGRAIDKGNLAEVAELIVLGADVNARYASWGSGDSPRPMLYHALYREQKEIALYLLNYPIEQQVDLTQQHRNQNTALLYAIGTYPDVEVITTLIERGSDLQAKNWQEETAVHLAAEKGRLAVLTLLLDAGADINALDKYGRTPLHRATSGGHYPVVEALLLREAKTDIVDNSGNQAIDIIHGSYPGISRLFKPENKAEELANKSVTEAGWKLTAPDEIAYQDNREVIGYRLTRIFNFNVRTYTQITQNTQTNAESQIMRFFDEFTDAKPIEEAYAALLREGGQADESAISGLRIIKKSIRQP